MHDIGVQFEGDKKNKGMVQNRLKYFTKCSFLHPYTPSHFPFIVSVILLYSNVINELMKFNSFYYFNIKNSTKTRFSIFIFKNSFHFLIKCILKKR